MKKFFASMLVVAMLLVAGIASATSITANPPSIEVQGGQIATSTVTGTSSHPNGTLRYNKISGPSWATLEGTTVTFAPLADEAAGTKDPVVIEVVETFTPSDSAGHSGTSTDRAEVSIPVNVTVPQNPQGGSEGAKEETVTTVEVRPAVVSAVKVISVKIAVIVNVTEPSKQQEKVVSGVSIIRNLLSAIPALASLSTQIASAPVQDSKNIEVIESPNYDPSDNTKNLANASARLKQKTTGTASTNTEKRAIGVVRPFRSAKQGLQPIDLPKADKAFYGKKPGIDMGKREVTQVNNSSFFASDTTGGNEAIFLNSLGNSTDVIPGKADNGTVYGDPSADEGVVTAVVFVEEGAEYEPILMTELASADVASFETATGTSEEANVAVADVVLVEVKAMTTATFNPVVAQAVRAVISNDYGKPVSELPYRAASATAWAATSDETTYMSENNLVRVCSLPTLENVPDGVYVAEIVFDNQPGLGVNIGKPTLYPDGISATATAAKSTVYVLNSNDCVAITDTNAATYVKNGQTAYLVFEVANNAVVSAAEEDFEAAAVSLSRPSLVVKTTAVVPPASDDVVLKALNTKGYVSNDLKTIMPAGFKRGYMVLTEGVSSTPVELNFSVVSSSWAVSVAGETDTITPSSSVADSATAIGSITDATPTSATITLEPTEITLGRHNVTLSVLPVSGDVKAGTAVSAVIGYVVGTKQPVDTGDVGVSSSSGGCSAGSAVLALAVLGAFIATRKK